MRFHRRGLPIWLASVAGLAISIWLQLLAGGVGVDKGLPTWLASVALSFLAWGPSIVGWL